MTTEIAFLLSGLALGFLIGGGIVLFWSPSKSHLFYNDKEFFK
jgi:hypothetical protein